MLSLNVWQAVGSRALRPMGRCCCAVDAAVGSKDLDVPGVARALRLEEIVSSTAVRETRRKSMGGEELCMSVSVRWVVQREGSLPLRAVWLKQNCGRSIGVSGFRDMLGGGGESGDGEDQK